MGSARRRALKWPALDTTLVPVASSDETLLQQWAEGDGAAGNELVQRHFRPVFRFLVRRSGDAAEDIAQKTFELALTQRDRFRSDGSFRAYLFGIAHNQSLMHRRKVAIQERHVVDDQASRAAELTSPSARAAAREEHKVLLRAMRTLKDDLQITLELHYWEGLSNAEIGEVLGIPTSTVSSRLWRARELIREAVRNMDIPAALRESTVQGMDGWVRSIREHLQGPGESP